MRDLLKLALLVRAAHERREDSWRPGVGAGHGSYGLTLDAAINVALADLSAGDEFKTPVLLLLTWSNDALDWATEMLKEQLPGIDQAGADTEALAEAAEQAS